MIMGDLPERSTDVIHGGSTHDSVSCQGLMDDYSDGGDTSSITDEMTSFEDQADSGSGCDGNLSDMSDNDDESIGERFKFLEKKRVLLQRASLLIDGDNQYEASIAKKVSASCEGEPPIWGNAKQVLKELSKRSPLVRKQVKFAVSKRGIKHDRKGSSHKKIRIDFASCVELVTSKSNTDQRTTPCSVESSQASNPEKYDDVDLAGYSKLEENPTINDWQMMVDSMTMPTIAPKPAIKDALVKLEDALVITDSPQLVVEASSPFRVVHANGAFMNSSGLLKVIGQPMENFLSIRGDFLKQTAAREPIHATVSSSTSCKLHMTPIMSHSNEATMSYVLIKFTDMVSSSKTAAINQLVGTIG